MGVGVGVGVGFEVGLGVDLEDGLGMARGVPSPVMAELGAVAWATGANEAEAGSDSGRSVGSALGVAVDVGAGGTPNEPDAVGWNHSTETSAARAARDSVAPIMRPGPRPAKVLRSHLSQPSRSGGSRIGNDEPPPGVAFGAMAAGDCAPPDPFRSRAIPSTPGRQVRGRSSPDEQVTVVGGAEGTALARGAARARRGGRGDALPPLCGGGGPQRPRLTGRRRAPPQRRHVGPRDIRRTSDTSTSRRPPPMSSR